MSYRREHPHHYAAVINPKKVYTYPELGRLWNVAVSTAYGRVQAMRLAGYTITVSSRKKGCLSRYAPRKYVLVDDLGNTDIICPECDRARRRGKNGETVHLHHHIPGADDPACETEFCRACGYWPQADEAEEIQITIARFNSGHIKPVARWI